MSDRNFTQRCDVVMTSLSSDNKIMVQQCYICGERCHCSNLFEQIVSRGQNPIACSKRSKSLEKVGLFFKPFRELNW